MGINCRHIFYPYIEGVSTKRYEPYPEKENREAYEQSQKQRYFERRIRKAKRELAMVEGLDDPKAIKKAKEKIKDRQATMRNFIDESGRRRRYEREKAY